MQPNIAMWLAEPGNDVIYTDNVWMSQPISHVEEEKWFEALELGIFAEEYNRLSDLAWINRVSLALSYDNFHTGE